MSLENKLYELKVERNRLLGKVREIEIECASEYDKLLGYMDLVDEDEIHLDRHVVAINDKIDRQESIMMAIQGKLDGIVNKIEELEDELIYRRTRGMEERLPDCVIEALF